MNKNKKEDNDKTLYNFDFEDKRKNKKKKENKKNNKKQESNHLNENEIIIGVTVHPEDKKNNKIKNKKDKTIIKKQKTNNKDTKKISKKSKKIILNNNFEEIDSEKEIENKNLKKRKKESNHVNKEKPRKRLKLLKWTSILVVLFIGLIFLLLSPIFNLNNIIVNGNDKISKSSIVDLSKLNNGENIFRINKKQIINSIKENGYIESVKIKRVLPDEIEINVTERTATFMIEYGTGYVYINNQGYILEMSNNKIDLPIIAGISTPSDEIIEANRLNNNDLEKLNIVLKIMSVAEINNIKSLITNIDISDDNDYKVTFGSAGKVAYLGDCSNIETRMLYVAAILTNEEGKSGEIFVNMNLNSENPFFRESVR